MARGKKPNPNQIGMLSQNQYGSETPQGSAPPRARARRTDPSTSHQAAASVTNITTKQAAVFAVVKKYGPMTDKHLIRVYEGIVAERGSINGVRLPDQSDSGIRTRRCELVDAQPPRIVEHDRVKRDGGRSEIRWKAAAT